MEIDALCRKGRLRKQGAESAYSRTIASHGTTAARVIPAKSRKLRTVFGAAQNQNNNVKTMT